MSHAELALTAASARWDVTAGGNPAEHPRTRSALARQGPRVREQAFGLLDSAQLQAAACHTEAVVMISASHNDQTRSLGYGFSVGDDAGVESNRPKLPEAFDCTQTPGLAAVWSGSGVT
jgi:hypothetical protein